MLVHVPPVACSDGHTRRRQELEHSYGEAAVIVNAKARGAPAKTAFVPKGYSKEGGERQVCDWCASTVFARYRTVQP